MTSQDTNDEGIRFVFYGRVSTEDRQDPEVSRGWQLQSAMRLIQGHGTIVREYFDIGQSRSVVWKRRPQASSLLADVANPKRDFDAIVISEPQRAFSGPQFSNIYPTLQHYGVDVWLPEVGGRFDAKSDVHDLLMMIFGGLGAAERRVVQRRVIGAMEAATINAGRFLGGRPPYGYVIGDAGPHPHPAKAADGIRAHRLDVDPAAASVVQRIFQMRLDGAGFRTIASRLNADGIPCPSAHDRRRNPHRKADGWQAATVRAILENARYTGHQVWGRFQRFDRLVDPTDASAGTLVRFRRSEPERVVSSTNPSHEALISVEDFERVQTTLKRSTASSRSAPRSPRTSKTPYLLRGLLHCGICGRKMEGSRTRSTDIYYRCRVRDTVPGAPGEHPSNVMFREDWLIHGLDNWLRAVFSPENVEETVEAMISATEPSMADVARREAVDRRLKEAESKLSRFKEALAAGVDPHLAAAWINDAQKEVVEARAEQTTLTTSAAATLTREELRAIVTDFSLLTTRLGQVASTVRAEIYATLGVRITYDPSTSSVEAEVSPTHQMLGKTSVRGGT
ncbi:recombinase family protein [Candidatus Blastococcus massiliensis]|uniref:recombinase family protein n=1 Tax=Candidatus Blastococcus massiliensis TaxID=1470358 RepID=UPI0006840667|nr:recombinase family protein [Candidatus Blastococcus massiliensis]